MLMQHFLFIRFHNVGIFVFDEVEQFDFVSVFILGNRRLQINQIAFVFIGP